MVTFDHIQDDRKNNLRKNVAGILVPWSKTVRLQFCNICSQKTQFFCNIIARD